jgi:hypothetical protein
MDELRFLLNLQFYRCCFSSAGCIECNEMGYEAIRRKFYKDRNVNKNKIKN